MLTIPAHKLEAALTHCAVRDIRYYLNGVYLEAAESGDLHIIATDGHRMLCGRIPNGAANAPDFKSVIIPSETAKLAVKGKGDVELAWDAGVWRLGTYLFKPVDGVFPPWRRAIPTLDLAAPPTDWDYTYLESAQTALRLWTGHKTMTVRKLDCEGNSCVVACFDPDVFCVVVALRNYGATVIEPPFTPAAAR